MDDLGRFLKVFGLSQIGIVGGLVFVMYALDQTDFGRYFWSGLMPAMRIIGLVESVGGVLSIVFAMMDQTILELEDRLKKARSTTKVRDHTIKEFKESFSELAAQVIQDGLTMAQQKQQIEQAAIDHAVLEKQIEDMKPLYEAAVDLKRIVDQDEELIC